MAVVLDSVVLGDPSGKTIRVALGKPDHLLHLPVCFKVATLLPWVIFPSFRMTLKSVYPWEMCFMFYVGAFQ